MDDFRTRSKRTAVVPPNTLRKNDLRTERFLFRRKTFVRIIRDPHFGVARSFHGRSRTGLGRLRHERLVCVGGGTNVFDRVGRLSKPCPTGLDPSRLRQSATGPRVAVRSISGKRAWAGVGRRPAPRISSRAAGTVSCPMVPGEVGAVIEGGGRKAEDLEIWRFVPPSYCARIGH